jgi:aspartate aminotransferase-like enzyme
MWRIGCMGHTARPRNVILLLGALAEVVDWARPARSTGHGLHR